MANPRVRTGEPRPLRRRTAVAAVALAGLVFAACDTGDGKELKPVDPDATIATTVPVETTVDPSAVPGLSADALPVDSGTAEVFGADSGAAEVLPADSGAAEVLPADSGGAAVLPTSPVDGAFTVNAPWLDGATIDPSYSCDGLGVSPAVSWSSVPEGTVEIAVAMVDESVIDGGNPFVHWMIAGVSPADIAIVEGVVPQSAIQALNFFGDIGYGGPCPPLGEAAHEYRLTVYALNNPIELADGTPALEFLDAIESATIESVDLVGTFAR